MSIPKVVIVGRPNVGKSSLLNWLAGRRIAIVDDMSGVTRDRIGSLVQIGADRHPHFFELIDTGGIGMVDRDDLTEDVERQIENGLTEADLILFAVDIAMASCLWMKRSRSACAISIRRSSLS